MLQTISEEANYRHSKEIQRRKVEDERYATAERRIRQTLGRREAKAPYKAHELVEKLGEQGVSPDIGSAMMWHMIGADEIYLSDEWYVWLWQTEEEKTWRDTGISES